MIPGLTPGHTAIMATGAASGGYIGMQHGTVRNLAPTVHAVARLAIVVGQRVIVCLRVTIRTSPVDLVVIHSEHILPAGSRRMTSTALVRRISVSGRFIHQMAIFANAVDLVVIHSKHRVPLGAGCVAGRAIIGGIRMRRRFVATMA